MSNSKCALGYGSIFESSNVSTNVKNLTEQLSLVVGVMFNQEAQVMEFSALFTSNTKYKLYTKVMPAH